MQFQADMLGAPVDRPANIETTAAGAGFLAGLACGVWPDMEALKACRESERIFLPQMEPSSREALYADWKRGVERSREWAK
jgi:glycerol kinase